MTRRKWTSKQKSLIVLAGLKGKPISEVCNDHGITQSLYYKWRDQFLGNMDKAFDIGKVDQQQASLQRENMRLKGIIGDLTVELKKSEAW